MKLLEQVRQGAAEVEAFLTYLAVEGHGSTHPCLQDF
jgi:hypothetical protein